MKRSFSIFGLLVIAFSISTSSLLAQETLIPQEPITKPFKAISLGEGLLHPDGMTVNPATGDIILGLTLTGVTGTTWLMRIDANDNVHRYFELPVHPETNRVSPLGIAFGPDGHLYVADGQSLGGNPNHKGRILRVVHEAGKPVRAEVVVTGTIQSNGLEVHGNKLYLAESQIDPSVVDNPMKSGVFCFDLAEFDGTLPIHVAPYGKDPHFIFEFETSNKLHDGAWMIGANGIGLASDGTLYVANFGDQKMIEVKLDGGNKVVAFRDCNKDGPMECIDGLKVCPKGYIFFADYLGNAVCIMNPKTGKTVLLAKNPTNPDEAAKKNGALDRCSEVCLRGNKLYAANIDLEDTAFPTLSVIDLSKLDLEKLLK